MFEKLEPKDYEVFHNMCKGFSQEEIETINSFFDRMIANISQDKFDL